MAAEVCGLLRGSAAPVVDLGAGDGVLTAELLRSGRDVTAVEIDPRLARVLRQRFGAAVRVVRADMLRFSYPAAPYKVVSNVPYGITTAFLRSLFRQDGWSRAALVTQWEVARKRSGATMLTAAWWPWYEVEVVRRIPARAFRPVPRVDGGLLLLSRRLEPLLCPADRHGYQRMVAAVFTGRGAG
ncbi:MAG: rRNA adenine N(6)-methyltransferase family protein, partial [Jiangellaceae bacterium]